MTEWDGLPLTLTVAEAAAIARVTQATMRQETRRPSFPCRRFGRRIVISRDGFRRWLANEETATVDAVTARG